MMNPSAWAAVNRRASETDSERQQEQAEGDDGQTEEQSFSQLNETVTHGAATSTCDTDNPATVSSTTASGVASSIRASRKRKLAKCCVIL